MKYDFSHINNIEELDSHVKAFNEAVDNARKKLVCESKANALLGKSFGYIKESFENFSPVLFESKEGRKLINDYTALVKADKNLSTIHNVYESIRKVNKNADVNFFVESLSNEALSIEKKNLDKSVAKLAVILKEAYLTIGNRADNLLPESKGSFDRAVEFIVENKKSVKNLSNYSSAVKVIREAIEKNDGINIFEEKNLDEIAEALMKEYNEKFTDQLSEEEKAVVKEIAESEKPSEIFNKYKEQCKAKLSEAKSNFDIKNDSESAIRVSAIFEQVSNKVYNEDTVGDDVCKLIEIAKIFE